MEHHRPSTPRGERRRGPKSSLSSERKGRELLLSRSAAKVQSARAELVKQARRRSQEPSLVRRLQLEETLRDTAESSDERQLLDDSLEVDELVRELWECVQALSEEEEAQLIAAEDHDMTSAIAGLEGLTFGSRENVNSCLCPICRLSELMINRGVIFCSCGFRLATPPADGITLRMVRERLATVYEAHAVISCNAHLTISVTDIVGMSAMIATCSGCGMHEVVL